MREKLSIDFSLTPFPNGKIVYLDMPIIKLTLIIYCVKLIKIIRQRKESNMKKVKVFVEEHLCRCIEVEILPTVSDDDAMEYAENIVRRAVSDKKIILTADDFNGTRLYCVEDKDGNATDWHE